MAKNKLHFFFVTIVMLYITTGMLFAQSAKSVLRAVPSQRDVSVGETVSVVIRTTTGTPINALSGTLNYSPNLEVVSFSRNDSIVNFWIKEPQIQSGAISFEGVILNPGFVGNNGTVVRVQFRALREGPAFVNFERGSLLANDGLGTNILSGFENAELMVVSRTGIIIEENVSPEEQHSLTPLPVITEYSEVVGKEDSLLVKGKGAPNQLTKIKFENTSFRTLGEQFILWLQTNKEVPADVLVQNNSEGLFEFTSSSDLVAGSYNVTPALVDPDAQIEKPGFGVKVFVKESPVVRFLVVLINVLLLLVPIALLGVIIYFIPWYSRLRMRILKHKTELEDQEIHLSEVELKQKEHRIENQ